MGRVPGQSRVTVDPPATAGGTDTLALSRLVKSHPGHYPFFLIDTAFIELRDIHSAKFLSPIFLAVKLQNRYDVRLGDDPNYA